MYVFHTLTLAYLNGRERDAETYKSKNVRALVDVAESGGWTFLKSVQGIECFCKRTEVCTHLSIGLWYGIDLAQDNPYILVKGEGIVEVPIEQIIAFIAEPNNLYITDPMLLNVSVVEEIDQHLKVLHFKAKMPPMVTNRDFVFQEWGKWLSVVQHLLW